jgi:hypothetical protein
MGNAQTDNFAKRALAPFLADPKKTGMLAVLLVLLASAVGRAVLRGSGKSLTSLAGAALTAQQPLVGSQQFKSTLNGSAQRSSNATLGALQKWSEQPVPPITRNLFAVRIEYFPIDGSRTAQSDSEEGFWAKLEKSMALQADQKDKRENLKANITAQAEKLNLQSTVMGPSPRAMVNGDLVGEGDVVADFRVLKIESRRIIVEREGIRLEILMRN